MERISDRRETEADGDEGAEVGSALMTPPLGVLFFYLFRFLLSRSFVFFPCLSSFSSFSFFYFFLPFFFFFFLVVAVVNSVASDFFSLFVSD